MRALYLALAVAAVVLATMSSPLAAQPRSNPCTTRDGRALQLQPRDEAARRPDFVAFRGRLQEAVARRDREAILRVVDAKARVSFDGAGGVEDFKTYHLDNREVDFWTEFAEVLALGGSFTTPDTFVAPYTFSLW